ncbi:STAS domain-containing protein [Streptomyces sp. NBC_00322]|uniref:STAS domain-containing protein n=1 Tax=Streptomyces sp. NBC_00322 TaxID=2975712 RepID=UPI002E2DF1E6|nr:STAS domain-containing protein [Streptomyces sp. NBC_00322]
MASATGAFEEPRPRPSRPVVDSTDINRLALTVTVVAGDRARVVVVGEIDMDSAADLHRVLTGALHASAALEIDLARVSFCDCSGLHTLMDTWYRARSQGRTVAVIDASPCVRRLFELTDTLGLLTNTTESDSDPPALVRHERAAAEPGGRSHPAWPQISMPLLRDGPDDAAAVQD